MAILDFQNDAVAGERLRAAEVQLEQELEMARADMDAWASVGDYSPRRNSPRLTKEERAAEFLARATRSSRPIARRA